MPIAPANGIELFYETFGDSGDPPLVLVNGLGSQCTTWEQPFLDGFVDRGFFVVRFDNRDVGLSTKIETPGLDLGGTVFKAMQGEAIDTPYRLTDMAADVIGLLDHLGVDSAHVVGQSMGGMIAQTMAIEHPRRVRTMTTIMSTTGEVEYGLPSPAAAATLVRPAAKTREEAIESAIESQKVIGTQSELDEDRLRARAERAIDRCHYPAGIARQMIGVIASGPRADGLRGVDVPVLVIHGTDDPLVNVSGGQRTAELIPGAELLLIEGMGHDLPPIHWPQIIEAITTLAGKVEANG